MHLSEKEKKKLHQKYGEWAVVTGASSGIGKELATQLASAKFNLILNGRNESALQAIAELLSEMHGVQVDVVVGDMSDLLGIDAVIQATRNRNVGLFIPSAGFGTSGEFLKASIHEEVNMLRVNVEAALTLTHYFANQFAKQKRGGIILLSSLVAFQGVPYSANYAATKAYVQSLAEAIARELKPYCVDVLAAAPGPVASGFGQRADMKMDMSLTPEQVGVPILRALGKQTTVLPGFLTKMLVYSLRTAPRWGKVRIMEKVMGGMTEHQRKAAQVVT